MELRFRTGTTADKKQLKELAIIAYGQFEKALAKKHWNTLHSILHAERSYTDILGIAKCFVCELDKEIIGAAYIVPSGNPTDIFETNWSYIRMVAVQPAHSGNGIAKQLTKRCIDHAIATGEETIALHTSEFMDAARHIYEGLGFVKVKEVAPLFGKRYWLYQLNLTR